MEVLFFIFLLLELTRDEIIENSNLIDRIEDLPSIINECLHHYRDIQSDLNRNF